MPVRISIAKTIIMSHLLQELATAGYTQVSFTSTWFQVENSSDTAGVQSVYDATQPYYIEDYETALQGFLNQTAQARRL